MEHGTVLDIGTVTDGYAVDVAAKNRPIPYRAALADTHIAYYNGRFGQEGTFAYFGHMPAN